MLPVTGTFGVRLRRPSRIMYEAFPPPKFDNDEALRDWVRGQRREWLRVGIDDTSEQAKFF